MRQLSASLRLAAAALAVAASAGCMSVGEDAAKPGPSASVGDKGLTAVGGTSSGRGSGVHGDGHSTKDAAGNPSGKPGEPGKDGEAVHRTPVLIVGGSLVGLSMSLFLGRLG
ncbi:hypothetical protein ACWGIP_29560, partial [Streptomyces sp. NPDC054838]